MWDQTWKHEVLKYKIDLMNVDNNENIKTFIKSIYIVATAM